MNKIFPINVNLVFQPLKVMFTTFKIVFTWLLWQLMCMFCFFFILVSYKTSLLMASILAFILTLIVLIKIAIHEYGHLAVAISENKGLVSLNLRRGGPLGFTVCYSYCPPLNLSSRAAFYMSGPALSLIFDPVLFCLGALLLSETMLRPGLLTWSNKLIILGIIFVVPIFQIILSYVISKPSQEGGDYSRLKMLNLMGLPPVKFNDLISVLISIINYTRGKGTINIKKLLELKPVFNFPYNIEDQKTIKINLDSTNHFYIRGKEAEVGRKITGTHSISEIIKDSGSDNEILEIIIKFYMCYIVSIPPIYSKISPEDLIPFKIDFIEFYKKMIAKYFSSSFYFSG
ncbi:MAG: hypothetical protein PHU81_07370 [Acidobacteriota bacterium]|nr:hypothetical protein [Acidobacteriota bacterium]